MKKKQYFNAVQMGFETHFNELFGEYEDEYGEPYDEVYSCELGNIYEDISHFLYDTSDISFGEIGIASILQYRWHQTFHDDTELSVFTKIAKMILVTIERTKENPNYI
jgi:hypothetical protein